MISFCVTVIRLSSLYCESLFSCRLSLHDELDLFPVMNIIVDQSGVFVSC